MTNKPLKTKERLKKTQTRLNKQKNKGRKTSLNQIKKTQGYGRRSKRRGD